MATQTEGYPSDDVSNEEKAKTSYGLQYAKAMYAEANSFQGGLFSIKKQRHKENQSYRDGKQTIDRYKQRYKSLPGIIGPDQTLANLDFSVVSPMSQIIDSAIGAIMKRGFNVFAKAVDPQANIDRILEKVKIETVMELKASGFFDQLNTFVGQDLSNPEEANMPTNPEDLESYMDLDFKLNYEIMAEESVDFMLTLNEYLWHYMQVIDDLITCGIGGMRDWVDSRRRIKCKRIDPKRLLLQWTNDPMCRNIRHAGEILDMTVSDLLELGGSELKDKDTVRKLLQIGDSAWSNQSNILGMFESAWDNQDGGFPYHAFRVKVLYFAFHRTNTYPYEKRTAKNGQPRVKPVGYDYKPKEGRERKDFKCKVYYEGYYVIGSEDICFGYRRGVDMAKHKDSIADCKLPFHIFIPGLTDGDNKSIAEKIRPIEDSYMLDWLKLQQMKLEAAPKGMAIDARSIMNVPYGKGKTWNPLQILELRKATGDILYNGETIDGRPINPPQEQENGLPRDFERILQSMAMSIQMMEELSGITRAVRSEAPERQSATATNMAVEATGNSLSGVMMGASYITKSLAESMLSRLQLQVKDGKQGGMTSGLGTDYVKYAVATADISPHDIGVFFEMGMDHFERQKFEENIQQSLAQQIITQSDAMFLRRIKNLKRAERELARREKRRREELAQEEQNKMAMQGQVNEQSAMAGMQAKVKETEAVEGIKDRYKDKDLVRELRKIAAQAEHKLTEEEMKANQEAITKEVEASMNMEEQEQKDEASYKETMDKEDKVTERAVKVARIGAEASKEAAKNRPAVANK